MMPGSFDYTNCFKIQIIDYNSDMTMSEKTLGIICSERKTNRLFTERNPYGMKMS